MLLKICAAHQSDFGLLDQSIGDYYYKTDGSNTIPHAAAPLSAHILTEYEQVSAMIETRRQTTLVAPLVQQSLGLKHSRSGLTIRDVLNSLS